MAGNPTRNQHYLSRVEQKLNAYNPESKSGKFRIYSFRLEDRDQYKIALESPHGRLIDRSMSLLDLFSFDVSGGSRLRLNLESLFHKYEVGIERHTHSLLRKVAEGSNDIGPEIVEVFAAKLLNFIRNPFSLDKVLNSFPGVTGFEPTDPELRATYRRIISGRRPHQEYICQQLGVDDKKYTEWLRLLFMLLKPLGAGQPNLFEGVVKALLENRKTHIAAFIHVYDDAACLLSDRGYSQALPDGPHMGMSFNLCSNAFIDYALADAAALLEGRAHPEFLVDALARWEQRPMPVVNVTVLRNDKSMLARYNRRVVDFCYKRVYCSAKENVVFD